MFRFTDKEDRVGVGVYDVILLYDPGRKMRNSKRKQEPCCQKFRGLQISDTTIDPTERNDQKKKWS